MATGFAYIRWENAEELRNSEQITFNSKQERLHELGGGDWLWLVSRNPADSQYYFVARLALTGRIENPENSEFHKRFGRFGVQADRDTSCFFGSEFPGEGVLRALLFETKKPIKYGASIGQALQTIRIANVEDDIVLASTLRRKLANNGKFEDRLFGLWTKCAPEFADYFLTNWKERAEPLGFLLYDAAPVLHAGGPVFVHSGKNLAFFGRFVETQVVSAYHHTVESNERDAECDRIWRQFRASTLKAPAPDAFREFWNSQHGVRSLLVIRDLVASKQPVPFKVYGRALEWGYPIGVGYRHLSFAESMLLLRAAGAERTHVEEIAGLF